MRYASCRVVVILAVAAFTPAAPSSTHADTHYVSKTGSRTYPYDSWATAADTVARAVEAASEWDTILIAAGQYVTDTIRMKRGQVLRGAGMDSTILDTLPLAPGPYPLIAEDSCTISDFAMIQLPAKAVAATGATPQAVGPGISTGRDHSVFVSRVRFDHINTAIHASFNDAARAGHICIVSECEFLYSQQAIVANFGGNIDIMRCSFVYDRSASVGIVKADYSSLSVFNCRYYAYDPFGTNTNAAAISTVVSDPIVIRNNLFYSILEGEALDLNYNDGYSTPMGLGLVENNTIVGFQIHFTSTRPGWIFRSNICVRDMSAASTESFYDGYVTGEYNITWDNSPWDSGVVRGHDTIPNDVGANHDNYLVDPMFADTIDFLLQAHSSAIDAGDPSILDPDGSRSDIGYTGGPGGFTYSYLDLPPKVPVLGLSASLPNGFAFIWSGNYEADFDRYELERSPIPEAAGDSAEVIAILPQGDTAFTDSTIPGSGTWYYRVRAFDQQGNPSEYSNELSVAVTGVGDNDPTVPEAFALHPNYPNPFNAETKITYTLPQPAYITLTVYDALGRQVEALVEGPQSAGEHSLVWDAQGRGSGVYFLVLQTPAGRRVQKALLLK